MPDNYQEWTPDEAFWNEAWTDMERRLEAAGPRRRRGLFWWWLAPAILLGGIAIWSALSPGGPSDLNAFPIPVQSSVSDEVIASTIDAHNTNETVNFLNPPHTNVEHASKFQ